jgi:hypothetical protein
MIVVVVVVVGVVVVVVVSGASLDVHTSASLEMAAS